MISLSSKHISNKALFGASIFLGIILVVMASAYSHWKNAPKIVNLTKNIWVADQIQANVMRKLKHQGFATIIDLRPDGEVDGQPTAAEINQAAQANDLHFSYVPVPHGDIPDSAVIALSKAISVNPKPILLYCRSGRRAARTWSLVEASRPGGLDADAILVAVRGSGQSAEDLQAAISKRIGNRNNVSGEIH